MKSYFEKAWNILLDRRVAVPLLVTIVLIAFYVRLFPFFKYSHYGIWLQYDDSMFEYWLSKVLYAHGIGYWWNLKPDVTKYLWWWPQGRDITKTETPGLSFTGALLYPIAKTFGLRMVDWVGIIPAFYGALTVLALAILGWVIGGPLLALITTLAVGFQFAYMQRSIASFVEKMSPTTFFSALYLVTFALTVKGYIKKKKETVMFVYGLLGGISLMFASAFWGGFLTFAGVVAIGISLFPFIRNDEELYKALIAFSVGVLIGYLATSWWITTVWEKRFKYVVLTAISVIVIESILEYLVIKYYKEKAVKIWGAFLVLMLITLPILGTFTHILHKLFTARYIIMLMPWLRKVSSPLERSVAEHQGILNTIRPSLLPEVLGIGTLAPLLMLWIIIYWYNKGKRDELLVTMPIVAMALFATYLVVFNASTYLLTVIGFMMGVGGSLLLYWLIKDFQEVTGMYKLMIGLILIVETLFFVFGVWAGIRFALNYPPPSYLSAGTSLYTPLFPKTMEFMKAHCKYAIAWWDYGYMIGTVANATTVVDPATLNGTKIAKVALALTGTEADLVKVFKAFKLPANETCVFAYEVFPYNPANKLIIGIPQVGDFAKSIWMLRIRGLKDSQIFGHYILYLVNGADLRGNPLSVIVNKPSDIKVVGGTIQVRTKGGRVVLMSRVFQVVPIVNINSALLYKMIYDGVVKSGYKFLEPGIKVKPFYEFKHLKLMKEIHLMNFFMQNLLII